MLARSALAFIAALATAAPLESQAKTIVGDIVDVKATPLRVKIEMDEGRIEGIEDIAKRIPTNKPLITCSLIGIRSSCYQTAKKPPNSDGTEYYTFFETPIPMITIHLLTSESPLAFSHC